MNRRKQILPHLFLLPYILIILYPLYFVLTTSFKESSQIRLDPWGLPKSFNLEHYQNVLTSNTIGIYFFNSLLVTTVATVAGLILALMIAYAVSRMRFPHLNKLVYGVLLFSLLIPPVSLLIPLYILIKDMNLYNTYWALIIPYTAFGIPISVFIIAAFLKSVPRELEEAGVIDGLTVYGLLFRIVLPLTTPTLVTVFILNFLGHWNEYIFASLLLASQELRTLPVAVKFFMDKFNFNYGAVCASVVLSAAPVIIVYAILQRKIIEGVAAGSLKG
ncbi:carbohydrate ABC transporter permease [Paenibacillus sp. GCM10027626]|uniref:carbohydrate ABC transporter permease n=1 Tax=Paenibacillus sp. GCM10027626 TaxID=3273411 RepID=UPI00364502C4